MRSEFTMKDMAECERPYEKCLLEGAAVLSDAELLAVILRCGSRHGNALLCCISTSCKEELQLVIIDIGKALRC